jgi:hypothetical protein
VVSEQEGGDIQHNTQAAGYSIHRGLGPYSLADANGRIFRTD